jgi:hypothetical protein
VLLLLQLRVDLQLLGCSIDWRLLLMLHMWSKLHLQCALHGYIDYFFSQSR